MNEQKLAFVIVLIIAFALSDIFLKVTKKALQSKNKNAKAENVEDIANE